MKVEVDRSQCQEVRLAVVMYGGVSLAIYMNGVTQELLRLVRATAVQRNGDSWDRSPFLSQPEGTEKVYRKVGQILQRGGGIGPDHEPPADAPILTNVVIDILSGTSAGGINAVCLAKALVVDADLRPLRDLWFDEGDIARLVNDSGSLRGMSGLRRQSPPRSLLSSGRMFLKLLGVFEAMDLKRRTDPRGSPYVQELDLYVTATDLRGSLFPIQLADRVVYERRYRNVFRFGYHPIRNENDFDTGKQPLANRLLAMVSRATSAFPFAFEPMTIEQADGRADDAHWRGFLRSRVLPIAQEDKYWTPPEARAFGDGGYIDNKPFGYAVEALGRREEHSPVPVDRKLVYIEPAPKRPELEAVQRDPPDAVENVGLALLSIPRYETIREDLEGLLSRNRLVRWTVEILRGMEVDVEQAGEPPKLPGRDEFAGLDLTRMIEMMGISYGAYQRLKVYVLTDEIAGAFAAAGGFDRKSSEFEAIRTIIRAWRDEHYVDYLEKGPEKKTHNAFLVHFDLPFRIRRLQFIERKIDELFGPPDEDHDRKKDSRTGGAVDIGHAEEIDRVRSDPELASAFGEELTTIKQSISDVLRGLKEYRAVLQTASVHHPMRPVLERVGITHDMLKAILRRPTFEGMLDKATGMYEQRSDRIQEAIDVLREDIRRVTESASEECRGALSTDGLLDSDPRRIARAALLYYYDRYDNYDMILYPIIYATAVGEERDPIEVIRISPLDAPSLIDESTDERRKLAGTALGNFGGFIERPWRRNDYLWGRLDGAERLISALLPGAEHRIVRRALIKEAHGEIVREEFEESGQDQLSKLMARAVMTSRSKAPNEIALRKILEESPNAVGRPEIEAILMHALEKDVLLEFLERNYSVDRNVDRKAAMQVASRATRVVGRMLDEIARNRNVGVAQTRWFSRLAQAFWGVVVVAVPGSFASLVFQHVLKLLYAFEVFLLLGGWVSGYDGVQRFGLVSLGATLTLHVLVLMLEDFMRRRKAFTTFVVVLAVGVVIAYAAFGAAVAFAPDSWTVLGIDLGLEGWLRYVWRYPWIPPAAFGGLVGLVALGRPVLAWSWRMIMRLG